MPARIRYDVWIVDSSPLARNLYEVLFSGQDRFRLNFAEEYQSLFKKSFRLKPDLLLVSSNALAEGEAPEFPCATIVIASKRRGDLKEAILRTPQTHLLEKPFYPYDLLSVATRMIQEKRETPRRGRPPGPRRNA